MNTPKYAYAVIRIDREAQPTLHLKAIHGFRFVATRKDNGALVTLGDILPTIEQAKADACDHMLANLEEVAS